MQKEELKRKIEKACYLLGGQINTLDNGVLNIEAAKSCADLLVAKISQAPKISRDQNQFLISLANEFKACVDCLENAYNTAIERNMEIRHILETGEEYDGARS